MVISLFFSTMKWSRTELNIIESMKLFPILYTYEKPDPERKPCPSKAKMWKSLANLVKISTNDLYSQWRNMLYSYIKINILIRNNEFELIQALKNDKHTFKYFDGSLSFLDAHINKIRKDDDVSEYIDHTLFDIIGITEGIKVESMFTKTVTQDMVRNLLKLRNDEANLDATDMEYILKLVKESVDQGLSELESSISRENDQTFEMQTGSNRYTDENVVLNVEEGDMRKFCNNLADYVTSRFSLEQQKTLRQLIGHLVTEVEEI